MFFMCFDDVEFHLPYKRTFLLVTRALCMHDTYGTVCMCDISNTTYVHMIYVYIIGNDTVLIESYNYTHKFILLFYVFLYLHFNTYNFTIPNPPNVPIIYLSRPSYNELVSI